MALVAAPVAAAVPTAATTAPAAAPAPAAELQIYGARQATVHWTGKEDASVETDLCVASTTGRFRLEVTSAGGGLMNGGRRLPYMVRFVDGAGVSHSARMTGMVSFEGSAPGGAGCTSGPNASITVDTGQDDLLGGVAGSYTDRLTFNVAPL